MLMFDHFDSICVLFLRQLEEFLHVPRARWPGLKELSVFVAWHSLLLLPSGAIQFTASFLLDAALERCFVPVGPFHL